MPCLFAPVGYNEHIDRRDLIMQNAECPWSYKLRFIELFQICDTPKASPVGEVAKIFDF